MWPRELPGDYCHLETIETNGLKIYLHGWVSEWFMVAVLKTADAQASVGSNPTPSAI
jgi:hypothetical protein